MAPVLVPPPLEGPVIAPPLPELVPPVPMLGAGDVEHAGVRTRTIGGHRDRDPRTQRKPRRIPLAAHLSAPHSDVQAVVPSPEYCSWPARRRQGPLSSTCRTRIVPGTAVIARAR